MLSDLHITDDISFEEATTLGVGITAVGQGLNQGLQLPWPEDVVGNDSSPEHLFIHRVRTATGILAIRFAKL